MNHIPWYRSGVFNTALTAFLIQVSTMFDGQFIDDLFSGKPGALARAGAAVVTAAVLAIRAAASTQPLTLTKGAAEVRNASVVPPGQAGFLHHHFLLTLLGISLLAIVGCSALGLAKPRNFDDRYAYAQAASTELRRSSTRSLEAGLISSSDAQQVLEFNDTVRKLLDGARLAKVQLDVSTAEKRLQLALDVLARLQLYLQKRLAEEPPKLQRPAALITPEISTDVRANSSNSIGAFGPGFGFATSGCAYQCHGAAGPTRGPREFDRGRVGSLAI